MAKSLSQFNWRTALENLVFDSIDEDFILLENSVRTQLSSEPFKADVTTIVLCTKGRIKGAINLVPFEAKAPCLITVLPDLILEQKFISDDFEGPVIVMSKQFTENLFTNTQNKLALSVSVRENPLRILTDDSLSKMKCYFDILKDIIRDIDNPFRLNVVNSLMFALFFGVGFCVSPQTENKNMTHYELIFEKFIKLVQKNFKKERLLGFYADKLCLTPKHLSKVIKETSGKSANNWIDDYTILEAKALLKSTNLTVQQICEELNFDCQSFFGKYFKRHTGLSPRKYKEK